MIDTKELRQLAQAATPGPWMIDYVGVGFEVAAGESVIAQSQQIQGDMRHKARKANAAFIAAANPATISELLDRLEAWENVFGHLGTPDEVGNEWHSLSDRLEAAEKDITMKEGVIDSLAAVVKRLDAQCDAAETEALEQARLNGMGAERELALMAKLEAAEKETKNLREGLKRMCLDEDLAAKEAKALRAKIAEMEKQEPHSYIYEYVNQIDGSPVWRNVPGFWNGQFPKSSKPLYALPGAQPSQSVQDGWREAAVAWEVCDSIHREYARGKDPFFSTRQKDFEKHANDARAMLEAAPEDNNGTGDFAHACAPLNLNDPAVQKRLAAQWGYVPATSDEYVGWYCAHCQRGVDASEVTYHEQHEVCGRVITNDRPPKFSPSTPGGYKLVPIELTHKMVGACYENWKFGDKSAQDIWRDMLAAAPEIE